MKKARVVTKVQIAAKPAEVFVYLEDLQYHHLWNPHLSKITPIMQLTTGNAYRTTSLVLGVKVRSKIEVKVVEPPKQLQLENKSGPLQYCLTYKLKSNEGGTLLQCTTLVSTESRAFAFAKPLLTELARRELHTDLAALKNAVEHQLAP